LLYSRLQFLTLTAAESILDFDLVDNYGWSVIHYAAAYGVDEDVTKLVGLGASLITAALPLGWNAIFHAVFYGNVGTFLVLLQHYDPMIIHATDARGWTLLHIAASAGHDQIVRHLLTVGADPYCLTSPFMSHMPESLFNKRCTPEEVAAAQSPERRERYAKALYDLGKISQMTTEIQETEIKDIFWDATEEIEILASERG
jgi:ankyrin repeat protein